MPLDANNYSFRSPVACQQLATSTVFTCVFKPIIVINNDLILSLLTNNNGFSKSTTIQPTTGNQVTLYMYLLH